MPLRFYTSIQEDSISPRFSPLALASEASDVVDDVLTGLEDTCLREGCDSMPPAQFSDLHATADPIKGLTSFAVVAAAPRCSLLQRARGWRVIHVRL